MHNRKILRGRNKAANRLPVDASKLNMGNTYDSPPEFYYDIEFTCQDCGSIEIWKASQQKWWYEEVGGYFFATAIRCRTCRAKERTRRKEARKIHLEGIQKKSKGKT